jgi:uncharacterized protein (TIGR02270 family)
MPYLGRPPVLLDIVEEHFDELDFLWEHREANLFTPDWTLEDLAFHEERAEAHLDGLRLSELHAVDFALDRIGGGEVFAATAATMVLFETGVEEYHHRILEVFRTAGPEAVEGIRIGLRHCALGAFADLLPELANGADPLRAASAADILAFHRKDVPDLKPLLGPDPEDQHARILALGAASRVGQMHAREIAAAAEAPEAQVRRAALLAAAHMGVEGILRHCRSAAARDSDPDREAIFLLGVLGDPADLPLLQGLADRPDSAPTAVAALGAMGRVEAVPFLIELMADSDLGITATAAYKRITGAHDIEGEKPFPPPEVPEGEDEEEALPPDPEKARADWERRRNELIPGVSWQAGVPVPEGSFPVADLRLSLETRRDLLLRLRARGGTGVPDVELEDLAVRQMALNAAGKAGG